VRFSWLSRTRAVTRTGTLVRVQPDDVGGQLHVRTDDDKMVWGIPLEIARPEDEEAAALLTDLRLRRGR
jgi:hypothetical protein